MRDFTTFFQERPKKRNISNETFGLQTQSEPFNLRSGLSDDVTPLDFATPFYTAREVKPPFPCFATGFCHARGALPPCPAAVPCRRCALPTPGPCRQRPSAATCSFGWRARGVQQAGARHAARSRRRVEGVLLRPLRSPLPRLAKVCVCAREGQSVRCHASAVSTCSRWSVPAVVLVFACVRGHMRSCAMACRARAAESGA